MQKAASHATDTIYLTFVDIHTAPPMPSIPPDGAVAALNPRPPLNHLNSKVLTGKAAPW